MPLSLQWLGLRATTASLVFTPTSLVLAAFSGRVGRYADEHGPRLPLTLGPLLLAAGYGVFATVHTHGEVWTRGIVGIALFSAGVVLVVAPVTAGSASRAPPPLAAHRA